MNDESLQAHNSSTTHACVMTNGSKKFMIKLFVGWNSHCADATAVPCWRFMQSVLNNRLCVYFPGHMMWPWDNDGKEEIAGRERGEKYSADTRQHVSVCVCGSVCAALPGNCAKVKLRKNRNKKNWKVDSSNLDKPALGREKKTRQTVQLFIAAINQNRWFMYYSALEPRDGLVSNRVSAPCNCRRGACLSLRIPIKRL